MAATDRRERRKNKGDERKRVEKTPEVEDGRLLRRILDKQRGVEKKVNGYRCVYVFVWKRKRERENERREQERVTGRRG